MRARLGTYFSHVVSWVVPDVLCRMPDDGKKSVYLTFDDGPTSDGTPELLEILSQFGVRATFFLVGEEALRYPAHVRALLDAGHGIGNHSFTHMDAWSIPKRKVFRELSHCTRVLQDFTGSAIRWMRPPFAHVTPWMVQWCRRNRQTMLMWDVMPPDFEPGATFEKIRRVFLRGVRPGSVVCLHDNVKTRRVTPAVLRQCLPELLSEGWQFSTL